MPAAHIVVAEDDAVLREVYRRKLERIGYSVSAAADGGKALDSVAQQTPNLMLCDIKMPDMDGYQVLEKLKRSERKFPIIILTNFEGPEVLKRCKDLGADDFFIKKDMTLLDLVAMVKRLLTRS